MILKYHRQGQTHNVFWIEQLIFMIYRYGFGQSLLLKSNSEENGVKEAFESKRSDHGSCFKFISSVPTQNDPSCIRLH